MKKSDFYCSHFRHFIKKDLFQHCQPPRGVKNAHSQKSLGGPDPVATFLKSEKKRKKTKKNNFEKKSKKSQKMVPKMIKK